MAHLTSLARKRVADRYRIDLLPLTGDRAKDFETEDRCREEDIRRAVLVRVTARQAQIPANKVASRRLERKLSYGAQRAYQTPDSLACSLYMRDLRIGFVGHAWEMIDERVPADLRGTVTTATISPPGSEFDGNRIRNFKARKFMKRFLAYLYRYGMKRARGWGCFIIHCEYNEATGMFRFHIHAVVCGDMIAVLDRLRKDPAWKPIERKVGGQIKRYARIRINRKPLENLPSALAYILKSYWPAKWEGEIDGKLRRSKHHLRIPGPAHTRALLWLDQHNLDDITLLVGLDVRSSGLVPTKLGPVNEKEGPLR